MTSWRHRDVIVTCNAITEAIGHININPNVNQGFHHTGKSLDHLTHMLQKCHDVMSWHHDVIVTCKTISGTNQNINLIPNLFPGFYYMGRSLGHKPVAVNPWRHDMTSWRHDVIVTCKAITGAIQHRNFIANSIRHDIEISVKFCCMHVTTFNYYPWKDKTDLYENSQTENNWKLQLKHLKLK